MSEQHGSYRTLTLNTIAFTICFAAWTMNGVLVTYLIDNGVVKWDKAMIGWLMGIPVLSGSLVRLPLGVLTDKFGGRPVYTALMLLAAVPMYMMSFATSYESFLWLSLGFGLSGGAFAVGIAYTSVWFSKQHQGTALGVFGMGNAGSALTSMGAPMLLRWLTNGGQNIEAWRQLPKIYAAAMVAMAVIFFLLTKNRVVEHGRGFTMAQRLAPLKYTRVWRFGLYYFVVFGGFVALAQWLIPYYVNAYGMSVAVAGMLAAIFSLPSGVIRSLGGWLSDKFGARTVMYWVFGVCLVCFVLLCVPRMDIESPGQGIIAAAPGTVTAVTPNTVTIGERTYPVSVRGENPLTQAGEGMLVLPTGTFWQEPVVKPGDVVVKKQLLARGITHIYFQANVWIFTFLVFVVGIAMGIGKAAVYKFIPDYYPRDVGVVGGIVGVIGGLGGFVCPIIFGYLLQSTGIWTTAWMFFVVVTAICTVWMLVVVRRLMKQQAPLVAEHLESQHQIAAVPAQ